MTHSPTGAFRAAAPVAVAPGPAPYLLPKAWQIDPPRPVQRPGAWLETALTAECRVMTPNGARPAGGLRAGDEVLTLGGGAQPVLRIWRHKMTVTQAETWTVARPIAIAPGALGPGTPRRRLLVSPGAGLDLEQGLAKARDLLHWPGLTETDPASVTYVQILLPHHALMAVEGMLCESLHPARLGQDPRDAAQVADVLAAIPDLAHDPWFYGRETRPRLRRRD